MVIALEAAAPTVLLDTSSISRYVREPDESAAAPYMRVPHVPAISFQTEAELLLGLHSQQFAAEERDFLIDLLDSIIVLGSNSATSRHFADAVLGWREAHPLRQWRNLLVPDAWIAATALAYGLPLATFDQNDFLEIAGLELILLQ